jgi:hypothetical protein
MADVSADMTVTLDGFGRRFSDVGAKNMLGRMLDHAEETQPPLSHITLAERPNAPTYFSSKHRGLSMQYQLMPTQRCSQPV